MWMCVVEGRMLNVDVVCKKERGEGEGGDIYAGSSTLAELVWVNVQGNEVRECYLPVAEDVTLVYEGA